jgi:predicted ribosome quality control (RQC) complex YloA/Tae2 family protein
VFEEAARFYEQGKRAKQKLDGAKTALLNSRTKLNEVEARMREAHALELEEPESIMEELTKRKVKHKEWFEKFRWFVSSDGFMVIAGRDVVTNEVLIKKYTENNDTVFHADVLGAPFVVVKTEGRKPSEQCLREAAEFAAAFSRGWREGFASIDVYWVKPDQLSKGGSSGESVPHGAFIVRGERNWMRGVPLRTAIGITTNIEKGSPKIVGGPVDAVKAKSKSFVVVVPDDFSGKELFEHILKILAGKTAKEHRKEVSSLSSEEMREFIPYGKGAILQK